MFVLELYKSEVVFSLCYVFLIGSNELFFVVGTVVNFMFVLCNCDGGFIYLYRYGNDGRMFNLVYFILMDGLVGVLCGYKGYLLVGVNNSLRIYDYGKKKFLRKVENRNFLNFIIILYVVGDRIYVGDVQEFIYYVKYKVDEGSIYIFVDDTKSRYITATLFLDYDIFVGVDKFGNIFVNCLLKDVSEDMDDDFIGGKNIYL